MGVLVVSFFRKREEDYESENPLAVLKRVMRAAKAKEEAARKENEGTLTMEGTLMEGTEGTEGTEGAIEMGEVFKGGRKSSFENVNPMGESGSGWVEFVDESSGAKYLVNKKTGETKWE
ncbi:hypothetical protein ScalyP_jg5612 [Parmales sp. scaly parma]|nr:hypothetical protein ScalyP_jg5612 [Parmales sp. scaly parma]